MLESLFRFLLTLSLLARPTSDSFCERNSLPYQRVYVYNYKELEVLDMLQVGIEFDETSVSINDPMGRDIQVVVVGSRSGEMIYRYEDADVSYETVAFFGRERIIYADICWLQAGEGDV